MHEPIFQNIGPLDDRSLPSDSCQLVTIVVKKSLPYPCPSE